MLPAVRFHHWLLLGALCLLGAVGAWAGCRNKSPEGGALVPVTGRVLLGGQPLRIGEGQVGKVWFYPVAPAPAASPVPPAGSIDSEGRYTLSTAGQPGAPPGRYRVMLIATRPSDPARPFHRRKSLVPVRYCGVETSGLVVQVVETPAPGAYDLRLRK